MSLSRIRMLLEEKQPTEIDFALQGPFLKILKNPPTNNPTLKEEIQAYLLKQTKKVNGF